MCFSEWLDIAYWAITFFVGFFCAYKRFDKVSITMNMLLWPIMLGVSIFVWIWLKINKKLKL